MKNNIVLIGFMGVGKGQVGRSLSERTSMFIVDCDDLIESATNQKIKKIFAENGEEHFRNLEKKTALWLEKNVKKTIISTGGGFIAVPNLKKIGTIVYLHKDFESIIEGILSHPKAEKKLNKRPLLQDLSAAKKLYNSRLPLYKKLADCKIKMNGKNIDEAVEEICNRLNIK